MSEMSEMNMLRIELEKLKSHRDGAGVVGESSYTPGPKAPGESVYTSVMGTCTELCPRYEYLKRRLSKDISVYESKIMLKKYERSYAGQEQCLPEDIRTLETLERCLCHLFAMKIDRNSYSFLENRMRAVALDFVVQDGQLQRPGILVQICRWYVILMGVLAHEDVDMYLLLTQLKKNLQTLLDSRVVLDAKHLMNDSDPTNSVPDDCSLAGEMIGYYILSNLDAANVINLKEMPDLYVQKCVECAESYQSKRYRRYFGGRRDFMMSCILRYWDNEMRRELFQMVDSGINEEITLRDINSKLGFRLEMVVDPESMKGVDKKINFKEPVAFLDHSPQTYDDISSTIDCMWSNHCYIKTIRHCMKHFLDNGNADFRLYENAVIRYIRHQIQRMILYRNAVTKYVWNRIAGYVRKREELKQVYGSIARKYVIGLIYKNYIRKFVSKTLGCESKCIIVYAAQAGPGKTGESNCDRANPFDGHSLGSNFDLELYKTIRKFYDTAACRYDDFSDEVGLKYDVSIFFVPSEHSRVVKKKYKYLNTLVNPKSTEMHGGNGEAVISRIAKYSKLRKVSIGDVLEGQSSKEKIEILAIFRSQILHFYEHFINCVLENLKIGDAPVYADDRLVELLRKYYGCCL